MSEKANPPPYAPPNYGHPEPGGQGYAPLPTQYGAPPPNQYGAPPTQYGAPPTQYGAPQAQYPYQTNVIVAETRAGMPGYQAAPIDYTTQAWIACLCCFWPTGLMAIMKANESRDAMARGDMVGAQRAADSARQMVRISWVAGILSIVVSVVIVAVYLGVIFSNLNIEG